MKNTGIELIAKERQRQIEKEGYTHQNDDKHKRTELIQAAMCYIHIAYNRALGAKALIDVQDVPLMWPWRKEFWKPTPDDRIRELTKAGALIAAEIDRLQRLED